MSHIGNPRCNAITHQDMSKKDVRCWRKAYLGGRCKDHYKTIPAPREFSTEAKQDLTSVQGPTVL